MSKESLELLPLSSPDELPPIMHFAEFTVLTGIPNKGTREAYRHALRRFFDWYRRQDDRQGARFDRRSIQSHLAAQETQLLSASTRNAALAALKKLSKELYYQKRLDFETWQGIKDLAGEKPHTGRAANWLTAAQLNQLMALPDCSTLHGLRDRALLATVAGCGLRRAELCNLTIVAIEQRSGRWVFVVKGKGGKTRMVPIPPGVKVVVDAWLDQRRMFSEDGGINSAAWLFVPVYLTETLKDRRLNEQTIYDVVRTYAERLGVPRLAPHDLRRTYAKLTREAGADLDQIQFSMGHDSVSTTQKYIGDNQDLTHAPGDLLKTDWTGGKKE